MFLREGQHGELVCTSVHPELHVLHSQHGELHGETFKDAQPQFSIDAQRTDDGRVQLSLLPEIHHGQFHQRYVPGEGMFRLDSSRNKKVFPQLEIEATLAPGQIMMLGHCFTKKGSLGHRFFAEVSEDRTTDKLLLIRIGDTSFRSLFASVANSDTDDVE
jgi:hypothetical protein